MFKDFKWSVHVVKQSIFLDSLISPCSSHIEVANLKSVHKNVLDSQQKLNMRLQLEILLFLYWSWPTLKFVTFKFDWFLENARFYHSYPWSWIRIIASKFFNFLKKFVLTSSERDWTILFVCRRFAAFCRCLSVSVAFCRFLSLSVCRFLSVAFCLAEEFCSP